MNKNKWLVPVLCIGIVLCISVTIWVLFFRDSGPALAPDYAPQQTEEHAEAIPNDTDEKMESPQGGGSVSLTYSNEVAIDLSDKTVSLMFANPGKSNQDMVVQIVIQDEAIVQSGTLKPGNQVTTLDLLDGAHKQLSPGGYDGKFVVLYYHPESGEKAIVNTEIPVTITVNE